MSQRKGAKGPAYRAIGGPKAKGRKVAPWDPGRIFHLASSSRNRAERRLQKAMRDNEIKPII